jgi:superfamily I DNA/RNA helicase
LRILNYPRRGIGNQSIEQLTEIADQSKKPIFDILQQPQATYSLSKSTQKGILEFCNLINALHDQLGKQPLKNLVALVLEQSKYKEELERTIDDPIALQMKIETLEELVSAAASYSEDNPQAGLTEFIDSISLGDDVGAGKDKKPHIENSVLLATLHSAKGLEFPYVFLCGMEEDLLPHARSLLDSTDVDEERRLCYVGMTRAQNHLTLSLTKERNKFGRKVQRTPSRFLKEIPQDLMCKQFSHSVNFFHRQQIKTEDPSAPASTETNAPPTHLRVVKKFS